MNKLFIWLIMLLPLPALAAKCKDIDSLSLIQKHNISFAYSYGEKYNLGLTLAAIALVESSAGKYRLNVRTNDLGLFQVNATTAENTLKLEKYYDKLELHQRLVYDDVLGAEIAVSVLKHFEKRGWQGMVKSYNEGSRWLRDKQSDKKAKQYLTKVSSTVKLLRQCEQYWK